MRLGQQTPDGPACGKAHGTHRQVVVRMNVDQFNEIHARAVAEKTSLSEQIRNLLEWGLESAKEADE